MIDIFELRTEQKFVNNTLVKMCDQSCVSYMYLTLWELILKSSKMRAVGPKNLFLNREASLKLMKTTGSAA